MYNGVIEPLKVDLHVIPWDDVLSEFPVLIQRLEPQPVLLIEKLLLERHHLLGGRVVHPKERRLAGDHHRVILPHEHQEKIQTLDVP